MAIYSTCGDVIYMYVLYIKGGSGDLAERLVDLSTQREDLQYQLSCCQGQLETQVLRAESAKVRYCPHHHGTHHHSNSVWCVFR